MHDILVVDDEPSICWGLQQLGERLGYDVTTVASAEDGLHRSQQSEFGLVILDIRLPGMDGLTALAKFKQNQPRCPVIMITAFGELDVAMQAIRGGAFDYIIKPFDLAEVRAAIERALSTSQANDSIADPELVPQEGMVGRSPVMQALFKRLALAAASDANVLIQGESGVGKELAARAIHDNSHRSQGRFVALNVAAISPTLAESELFGHKAHAFTGAANDREGVLRQADGGTLFLDEVADIPLPQQVKLLRALEEREFIPVGSDKAVTSDFRIIAATHKDLRAEVASGEFRHDLYYRINSFDVSVPALRDRDDDVVLLAQHFAATTGAESVHFPNSTLAELKHRPWRGNVRELHHAIEHACILARSGPILPEHLPSPESWRVESNDGSREQLENAAAARVEQLLADPSASGSVYEIMLSELEQPVFKNALRLCDNEYAPAARALGIHRTTLKKRVDANRV